MTSAVLEEQGWCDIVFLLNRMTSSSLFMQVFQDDDVEKHVLTDFNCS